MKVSEAQQIVREHDEALVAYHAAVKRLDAAIKAERELPWSYEPEGADDG